MSRSAIEGQAETVFICAVSSDIGRELALLYLDRGYSVIGTYRNPDHLGTLRDRPGVELVRCDLESVEQIKSVGTQMAARGSSWDIFIGAAGQLSPIAPFFECDIDEWCASVKLNSLEQLRLLHAIYPCRRSARAAKVAFLVGGGINRAFASYSAYTLGKIVLIKMCELLDDEYPDLHAIAVGTGWVNTKIHRQTLDARDNAGDNYRRTYEFVSSESKGTPISDIFDCIDWCFDQNRKLTGGRNFSVTHDRWSDQEDQLLSGLSADLNKFKLRRSGG